MLHCKSSALASCVYAHVRYKTLPCGSTSPLKRDVEFVHLTACGWKACVKACVLSMRLHHINLVDPASSHMLVSKIKPCMSQYELLHSETANGSLNQLSFIWLPFIIWITMVILKLIRASRPHSVEGLCLLDTEPT